MKKSLTVIFFYFIVGALCGQIELIQTGTQSALWPISVIEKNIMVSGVNGYLVKSHDDCNSLIPIAVPGPTNYWNYLSRIDTNISYMLSQNFGAYNNKIFKTYDGGDNWIQKLDSSGLLITHLVFFDSLEGIAFSTFSHLLRTKDGGNTWTSGNHYQTLLSAAEVYSDSLLAIGGDLGTFLLSKDRGNTWFGPGGFGTQSSIDDFFFLNKDTVFVIGTLGIYEYNFAKSFNGGINWQYSTVASGYTKPYGMYAKSSKEIYAVGVTSGTIGVILKSTDVGQTWSIFNTGIKTELTDIKFLNDSIALVCGSNGILFKWNSKNAVFTNITGIEDYSYSSLSVTAYPNPVEDKIHIASNIFLGKKIVIKLSDAIGQSLYSNNNFNLEDEIDFSFLSEGVYYLEVRNEKQSKNFKIFKK